MARPLRIQYPDALYHVMNRGLERRPTFVHDPDHARFLELLDDLAQRWQVRIYAYYCMTTHYHLLLQTPLGNLARVMRHLGGLYTQRFNRARDREGPLFRAPSRPSWTPPRSAWASAASNCSRAAAASGTSRGR